MVTRVLVLGGSGFLGRHVCAALLDAGLGVRAASRRGGGADGGLRIDLAHAGPGELGRLLDATRPDVVVSCAGATDGDPAGFLGVNAIGPAVLVTALLAGPHRCRLVHLGSAAEYGTTPVGSAVREEDPARPVGAYGTSKLVGTLLVQLGREAGLDAVVLRVFNPVGPGMPATTLLGRLAGELSRRPQGGPIPVGPLGATRDFVHVRDVADAVIAAATAPELPHGIVNVASGQATPVRDLVGLLVDRAGSERRLQEGLVGSARSSAVPWQQADVSRALADLAWKPGRSLEQAVADCLEAVP